MATKKRTVWKPPPEAYAWMERFGCPSMPPRELLEFHTPFPYPRDEFIHVIWPGRCCLHKLIGYQYRSPEDEKWFYRVWRPTMDLAVEAALAYLPMVVKTDMFWRTYAKDPVDKFLSAFALGLASIVVSACHLGDDDSSLYIALSIHIHSTGHFNPHLASLARESACTWFPRLARQILGPPPASVAKAMQASCEKIKREGERA